MNRRRFFGCLGGVVPAMTFAVLAPQDHHSPSSLNDKIRRELASPNIFDEAVPGKWVTKRLRYVNVHEDKVFMLAEFKRDET